MHLLSTSPLTVPSFHNMQFKCYVLKLNPSFKCVPYNTQLAVSCFTKYMCGLSVYKPLGTIRYAAIGSSASNCIWSVEESNIVENDSNDIEDIGSPWEGAIVYRRNPLISHLEYCTTLERLGLGKLSTDMSRTRASVMGLRVDRTVTDFPLGTPVLISIDVMRKKKKLRLDGILRTVITLDCNRCGKPAAEAIFSNFSLLLSDEPIQEPENIDMGVIFAEDKFKSPTINEDEEMDDDASIDVEDRLYFPPEEKSIDISKHMRDLVHVEITINALCDPSCRGVCLQCGTNLNTRSCSCGKQKVVEKKYGPLGNLSQQMRGT